jgi:5-methylcytosine-specific restriction endonuclease McrA
MAARKGVTQYCKICSSDIGTYGFNNHQRVCLGNGVKKKNKYFERVGDKSKCPICEKLFSPIGVQAHYRIVHEGRTNSSFDNYKPNNGSKTDQWKKNISQSWLNKYNAIDFEKLGWDNKRRRIIEEQDGKCNRCEIDHWLEEKLTLEVDHIDGNRQNNDRINLEGLCPNCHSLTKTWRGRNTDNNGKISDIELLEALLSTDNICQALTKVGMSPRGRNYIRAKRLLEAQNA